MINIDLFTLLPIGNYISELKMEKLGIMITIRRTKKWQILPLQWIETCQVLLTSHKVWQKVGIAPKYGISTSFRWAGPKHFLVEIIGSTNEHPTQSLILTDPRPIRAYSLTIPSSCWWYCCWLFPGRAYVTSGELAQVGKRLLDLRRHYVPQGEVAWLEERLLDLKTCLVDLKRGCV